MRLGSVYIIMILSLTATVNSDQVPDFERWKYLRTITPEGYVCYRASGPITFDGCLNEPSWNNAPWTKSFVDLETFNPLPRFNTRVKMLWDDTYLYIGAYLEEPHVWGTMLFRDQVMFYENDFEVLIDPNSDSHEYYEFEISPLAALWDLYMVAPYKDGWGADQAWNMPGTIVHVWPDGTLNDPSDIDRGWSVEFAIPWNGLAWKAHTPCPPLNGDTWRMHFCRAQYYPEIITSDRTTPDISDNAYQRREAPVEGNTPELWVWSPQGTYSNHCPEMWGYVQFSTAAPGEDIYRPDPLIEGRRILHDIYYSQRDFRVINYRWATSLAELGLNYSGNTSITGPPVIETTPDGYTAHIIATLPEGKTQKMSIRQDALVILDQEIVKVADAVPVDFVVTQNYPNPFNPTTTISFYLSKSDKTTVEVYNIAGQKVDTLVNADLNKGNHSVTWNAAMFSAGVYFYTIKSGDFSKTMKMNLLK